MARLLAEHDIERETLPRLGGSSLSGDTGRELLEVAMSHPIKLIANALGVPPDYLIDAGRARGVPVAALVGTREHAVKQVAAGVDLIVAQGTEAGGHCGEVTTLVLIPEVIEAIEGAVHYPWLPVRRLLLDRYPSIDRIGSLTAPLLVIAGDRDDIVPAALSRRLYDAAPEPKRISWRLR